MSTLINDIKYAIRQLRKSPGFTVVAIVTLALGLTVNIAAFNFVIDFFLRPLPAKDPEQLVVIAQKTPLFEMAYPFSYPDFIDFRDAIKGTDTEHANMAEIFSGIIAYKEEPVHLSRTGQVTERTWLHAVSNNYFAVMGAQPLRGRLFLPEEGQKPGADPIIVLTHDTWSSRFGSDPEIIGQQIKLNGLPFTVVGITPPGFYGATWGTALSGFVPATMLPELSPAHGQMIHHRGDTGFFLMARLQPGASLEQARAVINVMMGRLVQEHPDNYAPKAHAVVMRESRSRPSPFVAGYVPLIVSALLAMALLVLAVAVANVANLFFARTADRERELAIRGALGASRWRLLYQLVVESVLLAFGAGLVGMIVWMGISPTLFASLGPGGNMAPPADTGTDWRLFVYTLGVSLVTGIVTGLLPAAKATGLAILPRLKEGSVMIARTRHPLRSLLVISQVAISCVVLICAGLAVRSLQKLTQVQLGFQPGHLFLASYNLDLQRYTSDQGQQFHARLLDHIRMQPGVRHASLTAHVPFDVGGNMRGNITAEGKPTQEDAKFQLMPCIVVEHNYLETTGIRILEGRDFAPRDDTSVARVAIINQVLAQHLWADESAVGKRLLMENTPYEVIGVMGNNRFWAITDRSRPMVFLPLAQHYRGNVALVVRTEGDPAQMTATATQSIRQLDPDLPLYNVRTMDQHIARSALGLMPLRMGTTLAGFQGLIALLLAALGIFGLVSFAVNRRTREIGIRMAMGARTIDVVRLVVHQSLKLVGIGLVCGMLLALVCTHILVGLLYEVSPTDTVVFTGVMSLVLIITILACWLPTRRAVKIDPMEALRYE